MKESEILKANMNPKTIMQIQKDVPRSFPDNMFPKTKLTVYQAASEKNSIQDTLKNVLQFYSVYDK